MIDEICKSINNFFTKDSDKHIGDFTIVNGELAPHIDYQKTQLIRISGSSFNDGVHFSNEKLADETFHGGVWVMSPPQAFLDLCDEIENWTKKNDSNSPFVSESFGGYSYTKATNSDGTPVSWQGAFKHRLNIYRKARL